MTKPRVFTKIISALLSATLAVLSGLVPAAPALAADITAGPSIQIGAIPALQVLSSPVNLPRFENVVVEGINVAEVLSQLGRVNLGANGQVAAGSLMERLAALQDPTERQIVAAVAAAAKKSRVDAAAVLELVKKGFPASQLSDVAARLKQSDLDFALLSPEQRPLVAAASVAASRELARARGEGSERIVRLGVAGWDKQAEETQVEGSFSDQTRRLAPSAERTLARPILVAEPAKAPAEPKKSSWVKAARIAALVLAIPAAVVAIPHMGPVSLTIAGGLMASVVLHEAAHLWALKRLGDDTATKQNVSGNPLKLIDPVGTFAVPVLTSALGALAGLPILFGWAKPVPVDFNKLANPQKDTLKVSLAGPAMNAALATVLGAALLLHPAGAVFTVLAALAKANLVLAVFNMLPLSPQMDGFKVMIGLLPEKTYAKWTENKRLPEAYRSTFTKLYEGPSWMLNLVGMDSQGKVNFATRAITFGAFAIVAAAAHAFIGAPLLLMMLVCSYDYYCIREKIQNEEAVKRLIPIMQGIGSAIAQIAEEDDSIQSEINTEEIEHAMKNVFEDMLDSVIDSAGFDQLTDDEKWSRFEEAYLDAAVDSLARKGMSKDSKEKIREVLKHRHVQEYMAKLREWVQNEDIWRKWHSPKRKARSSGTQQAKKKLNQLGGSTLGILAMTLATGAMFALGGGVGGIVGSVAPKKPKGFKEALEALRLSDKEMAAMMMLLKDMTLEKKPPVTGRIDELSRAYSGVTGPRGVKESVAIVGKAGVGKTAIAEKLAQATVLGQSHDGALELKKMAGRYVVKVNATRLMRSDDPAGMLEAIMDIMGKLNDEDPRAGNKVVLFLDEAHVLFNGEKGMHVANTLKEPVRDGSVSIILATTLDEYKKYVEPDEALKRRFPAIVLEEATPDETLRMLENASGWYEKQFGVKIDASALKAAAELAPKFNTEEYLPGSAFTYFESAIKWADYDMRRDLVALAIQDKIGDLQYAMRKLKDQLQKTERVTENLKKDEPTTVEFYNLAVKLSQELVDLYRQQAAIPAEGTPVVDGDLVKLAIARETGIASGQLTLGKEPIEKYLKMEEEVGKRVIGQPEAISAIARSVRQNKAGLSDPKRPLGVYYLTGPTGSGKTHLAKELARFLFDDPEAVVRVDMSEYMESHSVSKFIGSPPGYVGFESGGQLTEAVRKKPYSVVLFDEIEKAHPQVWLMMLQILGEGRLTDGQGKTTSFKNTIILMTSNLGMHAVDVDPFVKAFNDLRAEEKAAEGDRIKLREIEQKKLALAEQLSVQSKEATQAITAQAFKDTYPPEFEGRLSAGPIVFNRITPDMAKQIAELQLKELRGVLAFAGHEFLWTEGVKKKVVDEGFSVRLGARPLQNAIDRLITQNIATEILKTAQRTGGKVEPSSINALLDENGEIKLEIKALPPKVVTKASPEGAARELFTTVLETTLTAAADTAAPAPTIQVIDGWIKAALAANPASGSEPSQTASGNALPLVDQPQDETRRTNPDGSERTNAPTVRPGLMTIGAPSPVGAAGARSFAAENNDPERKDAGVKNARQALIEALNAEGYPPAVVDALTRSIEDQADPYVGWLKVFVEQAKRNGGGAPQLAFQVDAQAVRLQITRTGALSPKEAELLTRHFTGFPPLDASQARTRAETWNVQDSGSGMRLMLDLHRVLAKIPGAKLGVAQVGSGVEYWVELPKPPPAPIVEAPPAEPPAAAAAEPPAPAEAPPVAAPRQLVAAADGPAEWRTTASSVPLSKMKRGLSDDQIKAAAARMRSAMTEIGFSGEAKGSAALFLVRAADFLKLGANIGESITARWAVDEQGLQLMISRSQRDLGDEEIERLNTLIDSSTELKAKLEAAGGRVRHHGSSLWLEIPHSGPVSQADGQAAAASTAETPAFDAAAVLAKITAAADAPAGSESILWVEFHDDAWEDVNRLRDRGFEIPVTQFHDHYKRSQLVAPSPEAAARAAVYLAALGGVIGVTIHPAARARIRTLPASDLSTHPQGFVSVELDRLAPNHEDDELQNVKGAILRAAPPGVANLESAITRFLHETARKAKEDAAPGDRIFVDYRVLPDQLEIVVRRTGGPVSGLGWTGWAAGASFAAELAALGGQVAVEGGAQGGRFLLTLPAPAATSGRTTPAAQTRASRATAQFKRDMVGLMRRIIQQGAERGLGLRYSAADVIAAAASQEDLDWARNDWLRFASDPEVTSVGEEKGPQVAAAGLVIGKFGTRGEDEERLMTAMKRFSQTTSWDHLRPARTRLLKSLAKMLSPGNDRQLAELTERYDRQKEPGLPASQKLHVDIVLAMHIALLRNAGVDQFEKLVARDWNKRDMAELYDYVKRVKPEYLRRIYDDWKSGERARQPDGVRRLLALWAIADHGDRADMTTLMQAVRNDRWMGASADLEEKQLFGEALARMAQRLGYDEELKHDVRLWMREGMGSDGSYLRMVTAVQIAGAVGDGEDLPLLEQIIRASSGVVFQHQMTQVEAALAWGRIVQREGLVPQYWSERQDPSDPSSLPLLQEWLSHVNSAVNMAAAEALAAFIKYGSPARRAPAAAPTAPEHPFLRSGPIPDDVAQGPQGAVARLTDEQRSASDQWRAAFSEAARIVLGGRIEESVRTRDAAEGTSVVAYVLKQAGEQASAAQMLELRQFVLLLLAITRDDQETRERKLRELGSRLPVARAAYEALARVVALPGVLMGIDTVGREVWLRFEVPNRPAEQQPLFPHAHLVDPDPHPSI